MAERQVWNLATLVSARKPIDLMYVPQKIYMSSYPGSMRDRTIRGQRDRAQDRAAGRDEDASDKS
jgi:hypothetical protein